MESLLANYGSDDEDEEPQQQPQRPTRPLVSASLPTPKVQDDLSSGVPSARTSLFASLPRPKLASEDTWKSHFRDTEYRDERKALHTAPFAGRRDLKEGVGHKETDDDSILGGAAAKISDIPKQGFKVQSTATAPFSDGNPSTRVSLFRVLPPPKSTGSSGVPLTSQGLSGAPSKRVVELRPSINMALLHDSDDDGDDIKPPMKRHATEGLAGAKPTGLAAILPKPRNLGSALGSGSASGHQATLDVGTHASSLPSPLESTLGSGHASDHQHATLGVVDSGNFLTSRTEATSSLTDSPYSIDKPSPILHQHAAESWPSYADYDASHISTLGSWEGHPMSANLQDQPEALQLNAASAPYLSTAAEEGPEAHYSENSYPAPDAYSQEMVPHETSAQDALAEMLMREKRKGGKNAPVNIIEVKQEDLTATKVREDQLRTTGIAFGPAYKPTSTSKNKPSKLHRRKHQIGSLYYDMKQKEMELTERRARGYMTKAETQAKYGW